MYALVYPSIGVGTFTGQTVHLAMTSVSYTDPSSTVHSCNSGVGGVYPGNTTTATSCNGSSVAGGIPAADIMIFPIQSQNFTAGNVAQNYMTLFYSASLGGTGNGSYYICGWNGTNVNIYIAAG